VLKKQMKINQAHFKTATKQKLPDISKPFIGAAKEKIKEV